MDKRFSLESIIFGTRRTLRRFPLPIFIAIVATVVALILFDDQSSVALLKLLFTLILIFPVSVGVTALSELCSSKIKFLLLVTITLFAFAYYFFIARNFFEHDQVKYYIQYALWVFTSIILVTFLPFAKQQVVKSLDFWFYNQRIMYAFLATFVYSAVLFIGLTIAMTSFSFLFDVEIGVNPFHLWIVIVGIFCPIFFLSRYPSIQDDSQTTYPNELRKFSYYILAPLVALYFIILYSYTVKILISWEWPKGIISYMILGFSTLGIVTYIILHPLIIKEERLQKIAKMFFIVLLPQVIILFLAVLMRVADYGITENRYLLIVFGFWLSGISFYFLLSGRKNISIIPISLFIIVVFISFGPWSMFSISEYSQINRLESILIKNGMLVNGKPVKVTNLNHEDSKEIDNIIIYLKQGNAIERVQPWFTEDLNKQKITNPLNVDALEIEKVPASSLDIKVDTGGYSLLDIRGYDYVVIKGGYATDIVIDTIKYRFEFNRKNLNYLVYKNGKQIVNIPKKDYFSSLVKKYGGKSIILPQEELSFVYENKDLKIKVYFDLVYGSMSEMYVNQIVLFSIK
ncbi:MAG: hypothetical protein RLZZ308_642 [Candidatus Parcubacteria bacterium]|jgi:hypothetical protein